MSELARQTGNEAAKEIEVILVSQAELDAQLDAEAKEWADPDSEALLRLRDEAYHELYVDTPAKELLWQAEKVFLPEFKIGDYHKTELPKSIAQIELVEAYAVIQPDEGYRILSAMEEDEGKVEALAKYGALTSPIFVEQARMLSKRINTSTFGHRQWQDILIGIARAGDLESMKSAYDYIVTTPEDYADYDDRVDTTRNLIALAALGYLPALQLAKARVLELSKPSRQESSRAFEYFMNHYLEKDMARLVWVEHEIGMGNIAPIGSGEISISEEAQEHENQWRKLVNSNREKIVEYIRGMSELPTELGILGRRIQGIEHQIDFNSSKLWNQEKIRDYVSTTTEEYATQLIEQGPSALVDLLAKAKDTDGHSWSSYYEGQKPPTTNSENDPHGIIRGFWLHDKRDRLGREAYKTRPIYIEVIHQLNLLCLARAIKLAAIRQAS